MVSEKEQRTHALCSASGAHRWLECPGSVGMSLNVPEPESSEYAIEGTRAHALAEEALNIWISSDATKAKQFLESKRDEYADTIEDGDSMVDHVAQYVMHCVRYSLIYPEIAKIGRKAELRLTLNTELAMYGTADLVLTGEIAKRNVGVIIDLKYGKGIEVEIEGNPQLAYYAVALTRTSSRNLDEVIVVVIQPRISNEPKSVTYTRDELEQWYGVLTRGAEKALMQAMTKKYELKAGTHCRFCPAKAICSEHVRYLQEQAALDFTESILPATITLTPERLSRILTAKNDIKKFLEAAEELATSILVNGGQVPGWKAVEARTHRRWAFSEGEVVNRLKAKGLSDPYERKLKSPAAVEKLKVDVDDLTMKPKGSVTIAPVSDKRPALVGVSEFKVIGDSDE